jgi:hypothetical protein
MAAFVHTADAHKYDALIVVNLFPHVQYKTTLEEALNATPYNPVLNSTIIYRVFERGYPVFLGWGEPPASLSKKNQERYENAERFVLGEVNESADPPLVTSAFWYKENKSSRPAGFNHHEKRTFVPYPFRQRGVNPLGEWIDFQFANRELEAISNEISGEETRKVVPFVPMFPPVAMAARATTPDAPRLVASIPAEVLSTPAPLITPPPAPSSEAILEGVTVSTKGEDPMFVDAPSTPAPVSGSSPSFTGIPTSRNPSRCALKLKESIDGAGLTAAEVAQLFGYDRKRFLRFLSSNRLVPIELLRSANSELRKGVLPLWTEQEMESWVAEDRLRFRAQKQAWAKRTASVGPAANSPRRVDDLTGLPRKTNWRWTELRAKVFRAFQNAGGARNSKSIAASIGVDRHAVNSILSDLEKANFLIRSGRDSDGILYEIAPKYRTYASVTSVAPSAPPPSREAKSGDLVGEIVEEILRKIAPAIRDAIANVEARVRDEMISHLKTLNIRG